jgi:hypothetical protein
VKIGIILAPCLLAGCLASRPTRVEVHDTVAMPEVRVSLFSGAEPPTEPKNGYALEVAMSGARATDTQSIGAGTVRIGEQAFAGPAELAHRADFRFQSVAVRWRAFLGSWAGEIFGGLAHAGLDLRVSSSTQQASTSLGSNGVLIGYGILGVLRPGTSVQGRLSLYGSTASEGVAQAERYELSLVQALGRNIAARGGYSRWKIYADQRHADQSEVQLRLDGLLLGLDLHF